MRRIYFLLENTSIYQYIELAENDAAWRLYTDIYNAIMSKKQDYILINGNNNYSRFIKISKIEDCYITQINSKQG